MLRICEDTHIYRAILRGKSNNHIFEEEVQKKRILDVVVELQGVMEFQTLAYCVLDNEIHLLIRGEELAQVEHCLVRVQERYEAACREEVCTQKKKLWRNSSIREISVEWRAILCCVRLHNLPVEKNLVIKPEDYWWCSYRDYLGRRWISLADTDILLSWIDGDLKKAARIFKKQHQQKKNVRS